MSTLENLRSRAKALTLVIDGRKYIIRQVDIHTETRFEARYKGNNIAVWLDEDDCKPEDCRYYIMVQNPEVSFGTSYDGWAPEEIDNLEDAIKEALRGSCLLRESSQISTPDSTDSPK